MSGVPAYYAEGPEALVVSLASKGDRQAFAELVRRRQSWIRNLMWRCCRDESLADDLSQQAFLQAWRKIGQLSEAEKFGAWLKQLAINEWLQHRRKTDILKNAESDAELSDPQIDKTSVALDLDRAIGSLPEQVASCIVLSYFGRLSHPEIAKLTDIPAGTVKSHIRRGSKRLRAMLSAYDDSPEKEQENE